MEAVRSPPLLAGFCYTQFADTYQEANGLLYADRTPKFPLDQIAEATRGPLSAAASASREPRVGRKWPRGAIRDVEGVRRHATCSLEPSLGHGQARR